MFSQTCIFIKVSRMQLLWMLVNQEQLSLQGFNLMKAIMKK